MRTRVCVFVREGECVLGEGWVSCGRVRLHVSVRARVGGRDAPSVCL